MVFGLGKKKEPQEVSLNNDQYKFDVEPDQNILDGFKSWCRIST